MEKLSEKFLLLEFEQTYAEYRRLLDEGNQRIQFLFIAASIFLSGGLMTIVAGWANYLIVKFIFLLTFVFAFLVCLFTFQYMLKRRVLLDLNVRTLARIRKYFLDKNSEFLPYLTAKVDDAPSTYLVKNGFLVQYVIVIFSIVISIELVVVLNLLIQLAWVLNLVIVLILFISFIFILSMLAKDKLSKKLETVKEEVRFPKTKKTV